MLIIYGTQGCSRCTKLQKILRAKGTEFDYRDFHLLPEEQRDFLIKKAGELKIKEFPLVVDDNVLTDEYQGMI